MTVLCPHCKTILSNHTPKFCPDCGGETTAAPPEEWSAKQRVEDCGDVEKKFGLPFGTLFDVGQRMISGIARELEVTCEKAALFQQMRWDTEKELDKARAMIAILESRLADDKRDALNPPSPPQPDPIKLGEAVEQLRRDAPVLRRIRVASRQPLSKDQMLLAVDQYLELGEELFKYGDAGRKGYFSGHGWAAQTLRGVRDFIERNAQ